MSIWNKVLVGVIIVALLPLIYLTARVLKVQTEWNRCASKLEEQLRAEETRHHQLLVGTDTERGVRQLRVDVHNLLIDRRRVWAGCDPTSRKPEKSTGKAEVTLSVIATDDKGQTIPHGIAEGTVLYAFEELNPKNKGVKISDFEVGQYLGEFAVSTVKGKDVTFKPTFVMTQAELDRLVKAKRPWVLYELLPRDSHEIFEKMSEKELKALLPPESVREYLKDRKPEEKDDDKDYVVNGKFVRPLLDYAILFNDHHETRLLLNDMIVTSRHDKQLMVESLEQARSLADRLTKEIAMIKADKEKMERERDIVAAHRKSLEKSLDDMEAWIARLNELNRAMAGRIAKLQLEAAKRIDERTREVAQSGSDRR